MVRYLSGAPIGKAVLDVACGKGRHMRAALQRGHHVVGVDRDLSGVSDLSHDARVECIAADLESGGPFPLAGRTFGAVIVTNYLWRPAMGGILDAVTDDGVLIYETFSAGQERLGRPRRPEFLLNPGELARVVVEHGRLVPLAFEHARLTEPDRIVQRIAAVGPSHPWTSSPPPLERVLGGPGGST